MSTQRPRRHVIAEGYVAEWNLPGMKYGLPWTRSNELYVHLTDVALFRHARTIAGAKRRKGQRAVRVRVVVEVLS